MKAYISIINEQEEKSPFRGYKTALREAIERVLQHQKVEGSVELAVTLVSPDEIRRLNRTFRSVDRVTDVLSFPMDEEPLPFQDSVFLGDIIVCPERISLQAPLYQTTYQEEFCLMVIHSTLHLLGYDHMEETEKKEMFVLQEQIFLDLYGKKIQTEQYERE